MANDRLTGLDASFLHLEDASAHMHVAGVMLFEGPPPPYDELLEAIERRLGARAALPPAARVRAARPGPPAAGSTTRTSTCATTCASTALPSPGSEEQLKDLAGRVFSQQLDRDKPLWEIWLVEGLEGDRFAMLSKTHHALVDGISGVDIISVLFDTLARAARPDRTRATAGCRARCRRRAQLLGEALLERATMPGRGRALGARRVPRPAPRARRACRDAAVGVGAMAWAGLNPAPPQPLQPADRPAPPLHLGARRACATSRRSRTRSAAPSTTWCWPPSPARSGATCAAAGRAPTGSS